MVSDINPLDSPVNGLKNSSISKAMLRVYCAPTSGYEWVNKQRNIIVKGIVKTVDGLTSKGWVVRLI